MENDWDQDEWIDVFRQRGVWDLSLPVVEAWIRANKQFFGTVARNLPEGSRALELGCGPGRHAISLALHGLQAIGIDRNPLILEQAHRNAVACGVEDRTAFLVGDIEDLGAFTSRDIAAVTHGGLMEHLPSAQAIRASLASQLGIAPLVIFDVPFASEKNLRLFAGDNIFRQHWDPREWVENVLAGFDVKEWYIERHDAPFMTDDLVIALGRGLHATG